METKEKRLSICFLLIIAIFFGVCCGNVNRDLFYMQKIVRHEFSQDETLRLDASGGVSCPAEMLEARGAIELINDAVRRSSGKNSRILLILLLAIVILYAYNDADKLIIGAYIPKLRKKAIVLNYIQNKDGKK